MRPVRVYATCLVPWAQVLSRTLVTDHTAEPRSRLSHSCSLSPAAGATSTLTGAAAAEVTSREDFTVVPGLLRRRRRRRDEPLVGLRRQRPSARTTAATEPERSPAPMSTYRLHRVLV